METVVNFAEDGSGRRAALPLTGERTVPGVWQENYWFRRHEVVYRWALDRCRDAYVLDAGCGEGYGTALLDTVAAGVTGLDYDPVTIAHVRSTYGTVHVVQGNLVQLPFLDASFDVVVSFQTIEHLWDQPRFVTECARVCADGGLVLLSTPNRATLPPGNICHARELNAAELRELLVPELELVELGGLRHTHRLRDWERRNGSLPHAQVAADPAAWSTRLRDVVGSVAADDFEFHSGELSATLDFVVVARRRSR